MKLDQDYTIQELETAVEGLKNPLSSAVKKPGSLQGRNRGPGK
jgi:hypothetical protein